MKDKNGILGKFFFKLLTDLINESRYGKIWNKSRISNFFQFSYFRFRVWNNNQTWNFDIHELFEFKRELCIPDFYFNFKLEISKTLLTLQFHFIPIVSFIVPII